MLANESDEVVDSATDCISDLPDEWLPCIFQWSKEEEWVEGKDGVILEFDPQPSRSEIWIEEIFSLTVRTQDLSLTSSKRRENG